MSKKKRFKGTSRTTLSPLLQFPHNPWPDATENIQHFTISPSTRGFPGGASGKELACQCRRHMRQGFDLWVGMIPWRRAWQPTPVLAWRIPWTEEPGGLWGLQRLGHNGSKLARMYPAPEITHRTPQPPGWWTAASL